MAVALALLRSGGAWWRAAATCSRWSRLRVKILRSRGRIRMANGEWSQRAVMKAVGCEQRCPNNTQTLPPGASPKTCPKGQLFWLQCSGKRREIRRWNTQREDLRERTERRLRFTRRRCCARFRFTRRRGGSEGDDATRSYQERGGLPPPHRIRRSHSSARVGMRSVVCYAHHS